MSRQPRSTPVLMMVHAHPDDESSLTGGTLAHYSAAGWRTVLVTCTDGGQGDAEGGLKAGQPGHDPRLVAAARSLELDRATAALGVHDVVELGYPDSGVSTPADPTVADNGFSRRPLRPMLTRLVRLIRLYQPDVLATYPPNGLSGHPDHIQTHDLVVAAHRNIAAYAAAEAATTFRGGLGAVRPALYYIALSRSRLRAVQDRTRAALGAQAWVPPDAMAIDDADITTAIDVTAQWSHKLRALAAHASQGDAAALLRIFTATDDSEGLFEEYVRADLPHGPASPAREPGFLGVAADSPQATPPPAGRR